MMQLVKDASLELAEAVVQLLAIQIGDGSDHLPCWLFVSAGNVGSQSALSVKDDAADRVAWIFSRKVSGGIRIILGDRASRSYDFDGVTRPNDESRGYDFAEDEVWQAAYCVLQFFKTPSPQN